MHHTRGGTTQLHSHLRASLGLIPTDLITAIMCHVKFDSYTKTSAVAYWYIPRYAVSLKILRSYSRSCENYTVEYGVCKLILVFHFNSVSKICIFAVFTRRNLVLSHHKAVSLRSRVAYESWYKN